MAITELTRDWGPDVSIVRMVSSDDYQTVIGSTYIADQDANIKSINQGGFKWLDSDLVLVDLSDGKFFLNASVASDGTVTLATPSDGIHVANYTKEADDSAAADTTAETPVISFDEQVLILGVKYLPSAALTADDTNFASLLVDRRADDGSTPENIATITTETSGSGGTGDWVAFVAEDFGDLSNALIAAGGSVTFEITKDGTGVVVPAGTLQISYIRL